LAVAVPRLVPTTTLIALTFGRFFAWRLSAPAFRMNTRKNIDRKKPDDSFYKV
jgi:hypothetical protein